MYLKRLPRWARMEAEHSKGHHFPIVASPINISTPVPSSLYVTQRYPYMIAQNQVSSYNSFICVGDGNLVTTWNGDISISLPR